MILREGILLALIGGSVGLMMYGVAPTDPISFGLAAAGIASVSLGATYIPAARAARVDPLALLRAE